jgi:hypothetical protein
MKKGGLSLAGPLLLSISSLVIAPDGFSGKTQDQVQRERPKFYASRIVSENNVLNAKDSLGAPDGRYAEIQPRGQLVVLMEKSFFDVGTLVCKGEENYGLEGRVHVQDTQVEHQDYAWMIINRGPSNHFDFITVDANSGMRGTWGMTVNMIRITNFGTKSLFVDAVTGYAMEAEPR